MEKQELLWCALVWFSCFLCLNFVEVLRSVGLVFITFGKVSVTISSNNTSVFLTSSGAPLILILGYLKLSHSSLFLYLYFFLFFFSFWTVSISMSSSSLNFSAAVSNVLIMSSIVFLFQTLYSSSPEVRFTSIFYLFCLSLTCLHFPLPS